ncbi:MAG: ATP-binding protein [Nitrospiraceae bacterium]|nr:ATP-binding protein [Nitrospiraceae bacterium]
MTGSLQTRIAIAVTVIIVVIGTVITVFFTTTYTASRERNRIMRGETLTYTLSKAVEEGLVKEDLDLLRKASYVIQAPDVTRLQVFSTIWNSIDAFPFDQITSAPLPEAIRHFEQSPEAVHYVQEDSYDFYSPIVYHPSPSSEPVTIGYVRLTLSSATLRTEVRRLIITTMVIAASIAVFAIIVLVALIRRMIVNPVLRIHQAVEAFSHGAVPAATPLPASAPAELKDLDREFHAMCRSVADKERQLVESDRRMRSLFERVDHGIFRMDPQGMLIEANNRFHELFGPISSLCEAILGDSDAAACLAMAAAGEIHHRDMRAVGREGSELTISLSLYPERDAQGKIAGYDGYLIDISEQRRFQERLMRSQKLEAVGTLAGGMAHDFNNLLTAILGYSSIICRQTTEGDPLHKPAQIIHDAAKRGAEFGKKILTITRKEQLESKPVAVNDIVRSSLDLLSRSLPKDIELVTALDESLPVTDADASQLQQVIINLAVNARDAMPKGGRLIIETALVSDRSLTTGDGHPEERGFIRLSIADTGSGIDAETQTKIFDPFFTTKEAGKGSGLGLYIVHSIVNNHGGYINLYSEPGKGTRFNIYLPVTRVAVQPANDELTDIRGSGTILVIDDEPHVRELCRDILTSLGYTVFLAENGVSGIAQFRERRGDISLVILDMVMPKMGGSEVFRSLKTIDAAVPVLLYSGYSNNNFSGINELLRQGAAGFVQKPFSLQDIGMAIKKALSRPS